MREDYTFGIRRYSTHRTIGNGDRIPSEYKFPFSQSHNCRFPLSKLELPSIARFLAQQFTDSIFGKTLYLNDRVCTFVLTDTKFISLHVEHCFSLIRRQFRDSPSILVGGTSQKLPLLVSLAIGILGTWCHIELVLIDSSDVKAKATIELSGKETRSRITIVD